MSDPIEPDEWKNWTPAAQAEYLAQLESLRGASRIWYCPRGRSCDGKPHEGVDYRHARGSQWPPPGKDWFIWAMIAGRGTGKTRSGAEYTRQMSHHVGRIALVAPTKGDIRDTLIEGESGLQAVCERAGEPLTWEPSKRKVTFSNGSLAYCYTAEEPDRLRGPQHGFAWLDEPAHMDTLEGENGVWSNLLLGLRLGRRPRVLATTTPLPVPWVKERFTDELTVVTHESTYANLENLAPTFARTVLERYEGTRIGRQELHGEVLEDVEGALWSYESITDNRASGSLPEMDRIVVGVDPAGTSGKRSDETGIVVVGRAGRELFVLADYSGVYTPHGWATKVKTAYEIHDAHEVVAENNYGGEMVKSNLNNAEMFMPVKEVNSRRGKLIRAEPVEALYEQARVHHVGELTTLEDQLISWVPGRGASPDRLDALVHAVHALVRTERPASISSPAGRSMSRNRIRIPGMKKLRTVASAR